MTQGARIERVGEEFREILAEEIPRLKDSRGFVTVVAVKVSPDLRHALVAYTSMGDEGQGGTGPPFDPRTLTCAPIGRQVRLKYLPELEFEEDTYEQGRRIDELIAGLHRVEEER